VFSLITVYLVLVIVLPLALSAVVSCRTLPEGRRCSQCGGETMRLRSRWLRLATTCFRSIELHSRWCPACGWTGVARVPREVPPFGSISLIRAHATRTVALGETAAQTLELCNLEIDGRPWRVLLQSWCDITRWYGRILYVGTSGRLCADPGDPFSGRSYHDVLSQALALSEQILAHRLRGAISESS